MGYLEIGNGGADYSKAVYSFWFRVPAASLGGAHSDGLYNRLNGVVPLVMFGFPNRNDSGGDLGPSYIGITRDISDNTPSLSVAMNFSSHGSFSGSWFEGIPPCNGADVVSFDVGDSFILSPAGPGFRIPVATDSWHHLMLSFDVTPGMSVDIQPRDTWGLDGSLWSCWVVLDGHNYSGTALCSDSLQSVSLHGGPNAMLSEYAIFVPPSENAGNSAVWDGNPFTTPPGPACEANAGSPFTGSYSFSGSVASSGHPLGIPGTGTYSDFIKTVEMAELQIYNGVTCQNSGMFISSGKPASLDTAVSALGQTPIVYLGGTSDKWIAGTNAPGGLSSIGNFTPFGTINTYPIDPGL